MKYIFALISLLFYSQAHGGQAFGSCVSMDRTSNELVDFVTNNCSKKLIFKWRDEGDCRQGDCSEFISPGIKNSITKSRGHVLYGACLYPNSPTFTSTSSYTCPDDRSNQSSSNNTQEQLQQIQQRQAEVDRQQQLDLIRRQQANQRIVDTTRINESMRQQYLAEKNVEYRQQQMDRAQRESEKKSRDIDTQFNQLRSVLNLLKKPSNDDDEDGE